MSDLKGRALKGSINLFFSNFMSTNDIFHILSLWKPQVCFMKFKQQSDTVSSFSLSSIEGDMFSFYILYTWPCLSAFNLVSRLDKTIGCSIKGGIFLLYFSVVVKQFPTRNAGGINPFWWVCLPFQ